MSFFADSKFYRSIKEAVDLPDGTREGEVLDKFTQLGEYYGINSVFEKIILGVKNARKLKADKAQQGTIAVGGGAAAGAAVDQPILDNEITQKDNQVGNMLNTKIDTKDNQVGNIINNLIPKSDNLGNNIISNKTEKE